MCVKVGRQRWEGGGTCWKVTEAAQMGTRASNIEIHYLSGMGGVVLRFIGKYGLI